MKKQNKISQTIKHNIYIYVFLGLVISFLLIGVQDTQAASYYIASNGSDNNSGSINNPWLTIQHAANTTGPGDTIYVRAGTYDGFVMEGEDVQGGNESGYWTLTAYNNEEATLTGDINLRRINYIKIENLKLKDSKIVVSGQILSAPWDKEPHHIIIKNNYLYGIQPKFGFMTVHGNDVMIEGNTIICTQGSGDTLDHGIYLHTGKNKTIRKNTLFNVTSYGIHIYDTADENYENIIVEGNIVTGSQLRSGLIVWPQLTNYGVNSMIIRNNIFYNNQRREIQIQKGSQAYIKNLKIYNNIIYGDDEEAIYIVDYADSILIKNNIINVLDGAYHVNNYGNANVTLSNNLYTANPSLRNVADTNPIVDDPQFVNLASSDFHLKAGSPAIDTGVNIGVDVSIDKDGNLRPMDGDNNGTAEYDIGAYEYTGTYMPPQADTTAPSPPRNIRIVLN